MDALHPADRLESLDRAQCLDLLGSEEIGRLAYLLDGRPRIAPVNYRLLDGDVVFVSRPGAKLDAAIHQQTVAFEVDSVEAWAQAGWSVLVQGVAAVVSEPVELAALGSRLPPLWAPTREHSLVRITPTDISGRRVRLEAGGVTVLHQE